MQRKRFPESFTVGCGYLPQLDCFASIQCRDTEFAWAVAVALVAPLDGVDYWLSDDHDSYNGVLPDRIKCLVNRLRQRGRRDERVQELQRAGELAELRRYPEDEYQQSYEELIEQLKVVYPAFWDEEAETFTGPVSTNAIAGGNWRLKYGLWRSVRAVPCRTRAYIVKSHCVIRYRRSEMPGRGDGRVGFEQVLGKSSKQSLESSREEG